jgi:hypothetical protein
VDVRNVFLRDRQGEGHRPLDSQPGTEEVLDSPAKSGTFTDFPDDRGHPKTAKKASIIPKTPTWSSGRTKANLGRDKLEVDALLIQREGCRTEKMKTFGRLILETRKATRLTQKAVVSVFGAETVAKFYPPT